MRGMSRTALAVLLASFLCPSSAMAAENPQPSPLEQFQRWIASLVQPRPPAPPPEELVGNTVTLNPLAVEQQRLGLEYERALGKHASLYLAPQAAFGLLPDAWDLSAQLTLGLRIFVAGKAPSGIFFGPELEGLYERRNLDGGLRYGYGTGIGATVGWTLILFGNFTFSVGLSSQYRSVPDLDAPEGPALRRQFVTFPRLAFGVAF